MIKEKYHITPREIASLGYEELSLMIEGDPEEEEWNYATDLKDLSRQIEKLGNQNDAQ